MYSTATSLETSNPSSLPGLTHGLRLRCKWCLATANRKERLCRAVFRRVSLISFLTLAALLLLRYLEIDPF